MSTIGGAGEFELLERIKPYLAAQSGRDDAALIEGAPGFTVASTDTFVEAVHFDLGRVRAGCGNAHCVPSGRFGAQDERERGCDHSADLAQAIVVH